MKSKNQSNLSVQILEVEHLSITTGNGRKVLFIKPRNEKSVAYRLPMISFKKSFKAKNQIANCKLEEW